MEFFLLRSSAIVARLNSAASLFLFSLALSSCGINDPGYVEETAIRDCSHKRTIEGLGFYFNHYPYPEIETIQIKVIEGQDTGGGWESFHVANEMVDTLREQRYFHFERTINLSDTVLIKLKNGDMHTINGFTYLLRPHKNGHGSAWYGCDFHRLNTDGSEESGGVVSLLYRRRRLGKP